MWERSSDNIGKYCYGKFTSNCLCIFLFSTFLLFVRWVWLFTFFDCMCDDKYGIGTDFVGLFYIVFGSRRKRSLEYVSCQWKSYGGGFTYLSQNEIVIVGLCW
jgi:hypothetical protein